MWLLIYAGLIAGAMLSIFYVGSRFAKFEWINKVAKERKWLCLFIGLIPAVAIFGITWLWMGRINAMVILLHLAIIWLLCDGICLLVKKRYKGKISHSFSGILAIVVCVAYLACGWYMAHHVWRTDYTVETEKAVGDLRIVQFSDAHVGTTFDGEGFARHMEEIQAVNPDIVVVTGDYIDDDTSKEDMIASCKALGSLQTTYGVFYAWGNHDKGYYAAEHRGYTGEDFMAELEKNNVEVLQDEMVLVDNRFYLIGRQDRSEEQKGNGRASMQELTAELDKSKYSIVLDHQPHDYEAQEASGVDLVLSGHTHAGQLFPINYVGEWTGENDKTYGLEKRKNTNFIVTSGISSWAIQFKTGCKSEYVVVDVKGK